MNDDDDLLTVAEMAYWFSVRPHTLASWRAKRVGPPFIRVGTRTVRYRRGDVRAWIAGQGDQP